jgi:hypothetical protein
MYASKRDAVACTPPELQNISIIIPIEKLANNKPNLLPFTGNNNIKRT